MQLFHFITETIASALCITLITLQLLHFITETIASVLCITLITLQPLHFITETILPHALLRRAADTLLENYFACQIRING